MRKLKNIMPYIWYGFLVVVSIAMSIYFINRWGFRQFMVFELIVNLDEILPFLFVVIVLIGTAFKKFFGLIFKKHK